MKHVQLGFTELFMLDRLSSRMLLCVDLPQSDEDACQLLHSHGFAWPRNAFMHGRGDLMAWEITNQGLEYLLRQYRRHGGHV